jgi:AcrR family transcriptional regulator
MNLDSTRRRVRLPVRLKDRLREQKVDAILAAAEEVFAREGLHGARMEAIAERAGIAVGSLYNHFENRRDLLRALVRARRVGLLARTDGALAAARSFQEGLRLFLGALFDHWTQHGRFLGALIGSEYAGSAFGPHGRTVLDELSDRAAGLLRRGREEGALDPEGGELDAAILLGMARGVIIGRASREGGAAGAAERVARIFLEGAGKRP